MPTRHCLIAVRSSGTLVLLYMLASPDSAEAQPRCKNDCTQINRIDDDCKWNAPDCLRLEFWIEIELFGYRIGVPCEMKYRLAAAAAAATIAGTLLLLIRTLPYNSVSPISLYTSSIYIVPLGIAFSPKYRLGVASVRRKSVKPCARD